LTLTVRTRDGRANQFRLISGMAESGFLLSPLIEDRMSFAILTSTDWPELAGSAVTDLSLSVAGQLGDPSDFAPTAELQLFRLEFPHQDLSNVPGYSGYRSLRTAQKHMEVLRATAPITWTSIPKTGLSLAVPADSALQIQVPKDAGHLKLGYGIVSTYPTGAIDFRALTVDERGSNTVIFARTLQPAKYPSERETQTADVDLTNSPSRIIFETVPADPANNSTGYWSRIELR
jgi:hypothetical protein